MTEHDHTVEILVAERDRLRAEVQEQAETIERLKRRVDVVQVTAHPNCQAGW